MFSSLPPESDALVDALPSAHYLRVLYVPGAFLEGTGAEWLTALCCVRTRVALWPEHYMRGDGIEPGSNTSKLGALIRALISAVCSRSPHFRFCSYGTPRSSYVSPTASFESPSSTLCHSNPALSHPNPALPRPNPALTPL